MKTFKEELKNLKKPVWEIIKKYLPNKPPHKHYVMVSEYPKRQGKYFRPGLLLLSNKMLGGDTNDALLTAAAMQISEDWLLVHDDFLDHSLERRSTKKNYKATLNELYGDELAVNAGDALHVIMWKILGDNVRFLGEQKGWEVYDKMNKIIMATLEGQYMDVDWIQSKKIDISEKEYFEMIYIKAGYYTVTGPLQLGAIVAGTDKNELQKLSQWGIPFGCAFQIWDDVMNLTVDNEIQGKEKGGDILEGKRTLILIHLLKHCQTVEKKYIQTIYAKKREDKTEAEKEYILELMEKYGSIDYAKKTARKLSTKAKKIFTKNTNHLSDVVTKKTILEGIDFVVNRNR